MVESWRERLKRETREVYEAVDRMLVSGATGSALRKAWEDAAQLPWFKSLAYLWGPWLWRKLKDDLSLRVSLRPMLLSHLDGQARALDRKSDFRSPWSIAPKELEAWLAEADAADDVEVFRQLVQWKLWDSWRDYDKQWRALLLQRVKAARTTTERQSALAGFDFPAQLDEPTALELYAVYGPSVRRFIFDRLPWDPKLWDKLHARALERHDDETAWQLYRRQVDPGRWAKDVRTVITTVRDRETLVAELEKRHPDRIIPDGGPLFLELATKRGDDVLPYLQRHVNAIFPRWGWFGRTDGSALPRLIALADANAWTSLWARLLQTSATPELWNKEVKRLLESGPNTLTAQRKLLMLTGAGSEWNFAGFSLAQVQPLSDEVACLMDERAPQLLRGPFRVHLQQHHQYKKLLARVLERDDEVLVDFFASRAAMHAGLTGETLDLLTAHYEKLPVEDGTFIRRATQALTMMPAYAIWNYAWLIKENKLARLLFERSTPQYLADGRLVRELLESPQIHVQALAFRVLATDDPRAGPIAAANVDVLAPVLLRALHRRTRLAAFRALDAACRASEPAAAFLLEKMKQALSLPDRRYPREELVGLIGRVLARWPKLRSEQEQPRIFRKAVA